MLKKQYWLFVSYDTPAFDGIRLVLETPEEVISCAKEALRDKQEFRVHMMEMTEEEFNNIPEM